MAEGGHFSRTLESGSEALFDHECTQCHARGSKKEATDFCQDCKQLLCNVCRKHHVRNITTHTLVSLASMTQSGTIIPTASPIPAVAKCHYHPDREIEVYCGTHDMVYCSLCVAKEHRNCLNVQEIKEVAHKSQLSTLETLVDEITRVNKRLHDTKQEKSSDLKLIKIKKASLLQEINAVRKKMNTHLDALEQQIITELDAERRNLEKQINVNIKVADNFITVSDQRKSDLTSDYDEKQMFINEKLARVVLAEANSFIKSANLLKYSTLTFEQNDTLCNAIESSDRMGKIIRSNSRSKHSNEINARVNSDKFQCCISDVCQLRDGSVLLLDYGNNKLKRLDEQLDMKDFLDLKALPLGLCLVSPTEVAVRLINKTIRFIYVGKSLTYQRKFSTNSSKNIGMTCCNKQLWIPDVKCVLIYSLSGKLVKKIETDSRGRKIFEYDPKHIAVSNGETEVYVVERYKRVVVFNSDCDVIRELWDQRLDGPIGVCITEDDIVLVSGWVSKNIVMFDRDGNSLGELVSAKDMLPEPISLCYNRERCRLLDIGHRIRYKYSSFNWMSLWLLLYKPCLQLTFLYLDMSDPFYQYSFVRYKMLVRIVLRKYLRPF